MIKKRILWIALVLSVASCSSEANDKEEVKKDLVSISDTIINESVDNNVDVKNDPEPLDSIQEEAYKNDLSLEIKPLKEEIEDPISEECSLLLEEYASAIKTYDALLNKIEANPDNVSLMIQRSPLEENLDSYATKPQFFSCTQNKAFKKQFDILNDKKDKLLYN